jgi:hypothetical protein
MQIRIPKHRMRAAKHVYRRANVKTGKNGPPYIKVRCDCGARFEYFFDPATAPKGHVVECVACRAKQDMLSLWNARMATYSEWEQA